MDVTQLKQFGANLLATFAVEITRGFVRERMKQVKPVDVYKAIIADENVWEVTPEEIKKVGAKLKGKYGSVLLKYKDFLTPKLVMEWFKEDFPIIHSIILNTPGGREWFGKQVTEIKEKILNTL